MLENVGRKVTLIVILLVVSIGLMVVPRFMDPPEAPFQLGLDLKGGTRIVYRFDFEQARKEGQIGPNDSEAEILTQTVTILKKRIDPTGTKEALVRAEPPNRIVVEIPGDSAVEGTNQAKSTLVGALDAARTDTLVVADAAGFSKSGLVEIGGERIRFERREGNELKQLQRGYEGQRAEHAAGAEVRLVSNDSIREALESLGELEFVILAEPKDFVGSDTDLDTERQKFQTWQTANPEVPAISFNQVKPEQGGPNPRLKWYPVRYGEDVGPPQPVLVPGTPEDTFTGRDLARVFPTSGNLAWPAVGFEMRAERVGDFADFTERNVKRSMAILLNDEIRSAPTINSKLVGSSIIEGKFKDEEVKNLVTILRSGSLRLKPELDHTERVGATLGDDYVQRGVNSSLLALVIVVGFMIVYYRRLGVFAALALLTNLIMFLGGLAFLRATLTLPGIAGIVLTVGMAVDANILIFDRLREESEKGRNPKQAAKAGFDNALSAIIDSNVTTFLTALILYKLGSGPVRGFAVTLMIGILTSVFAALVTTRVFVHWALAKKAERFQMGRWMADANYDFLGKTKIAVTGSLIVCIGGLVAFLAMPDAEKLGIDFTGGAEAHVATAKAEDIDVIRARVATIEELEGSAEVKGVTSSAGGDDHTYTQFRISFKTQDTAQDLRPVIQEGLADLLLGEPVQVDMKTEGEDSRADVRLFFREAPPKEAVQSALEAAGLREVTVDSGDRQGSYVASAKTALGRDRSELEGAIRAAFDARSDVPHEFSNPILEYSQVGPQVVTELRDSALLALFASLFITVLYIRVRFAEYSFGIAAMVALVHDVLVTLAALAIGNRLGIVNGELNLAMIAVFLTIIGYSVNDTIVIFDRVRENLPKSNEPLQQILNKSINETLSRTIMTSLTVFLAIVVQYLFNVGTGNVLESISFAMLFGTLSGVYSTVYIANPVFLWLETRSQKKGGGGGGAQARAQREAEQKRLQASKPAEEDELAGEKA
jgi:SecD/SecF fusion protein